MFSLGDTQCRIACFSRSQRLPHLSYPRRCRRKRNARALILRQRLHNGPTADAKKLLDKHIASWATERGIKKYRTGQKSVNCELFLDFIVFDEHTCRAEADVCWNEKDAPKETAAQNSDASITTGSVKKLDPAR